MPAAIRILIVEDVPADAELVEQELRRAGLDVDLRHVEEEGPFRDALDEFRPDVILADYTLPRFDGLAAVRVTRERHPDIPVIIVTGSINDETAVRCLEAGAAEYVLKDHLGRLPAAVRTALERRQLVVAQETLRQAQHQLLQSQKMEAVGRLAGGVAHDFNNLLSVIEGHAELLLAELGPGTPGRKRVEEILWAADRAASLTRQLLAFTRQQVLEPRVLRLDAVVGEARHMLERIIGEDVSLDVVAPPDLWRVRADPNQIVQILLNLAVNARDAMPRGGTLSIELANADLDDRYAASHRPCPAGPYAMLAVSDTGLGMDAETRRRAFEPFFTTKKAGEGTGLGLSTVYGIVKQSGGFIWVYSEEGRGTTFKIYLPRVEEAEAELVAAPPPPPSHATGRILLVEDDRGVRGLMAEVLEAGGYSVRAAGGPAEALAWAEGSSEPVDVLVTDVVMPGMGGRDLAHRLAGLRPGLRVLFVSGFAADVLTRQGEIGPGRRFLSKPFSGASLLKSVAEALA
jgi:two-component system cell cycle sensor histidine kinase/response regulator CckA